MIPKELIPLMREAFHSSHIGINGCLRRAGESMFSPSMSSDIRSHIAQCKICRLYESRQRKEILRSDPAPDRPWEKVSVDLFDLNGKEYLMVSD